MIAIEALIAHWNATLLFQRYLLAPPITHLSEQTIKRLEELKAIQDIKP